MAKEKKTSSFDGTSGGALPEGDIWITKSEFGYHEDYMSGTAMVLLFDYELDGEAQERPLFFSTGSGWEPKKGGSIAVKEETGEPEPKGFSNKCNAFKWMVSCAAAGLDLEAEIGESWQADGWTGLGFTVETRTEKNPVSGEDSDVTRAAKFLGRKGSAKPKKDKKKKQAADDDA